ncbi:metallophosphoesterase [Demequina sp. NBRC 110056]|uniref:metallophosphoesterase n=1 Tax=Demequina sp. NBRC 110056 TaxID=1570345 RepID=UPI0009FD3521|nr:metallophosphoesterase [Demequina sp. NBRC 110056]
MFFRAVLAPLPPRHLFRRTAAVALATLAATTATSLGAPASASALLPLRPIPEPERFDPIVQVTEIAADSANIAGTDAYEFIEVVNASDAPLDWADFAVRYVTPLADLSTRTHHHWPTVGASPVLEPGDALVLWVRTPANAALTVPDFNAAYGTSLVAGASIVGVEGPGMANGAMRGIEVVTRAGLSVSRAYYNLDGDTDTASGRGMHYGHTADAHAPQPSRGLSAASPGVVDPSQTGPAVAPPPAGDPPMLAHEPRQAFVPGRPVELEAWSEDDGLLRGLVVEWWSDLDPEVRARRLETDELGIAHITLGASETMAREEIHYRITATDGFAETATEVHTIVSAADSPAVTLRHVDSSPAEAAPWVASEAIQPVMIRDASRDGAAVTGTTTVVASTVLDEPLALSVDGADVAAEPALAHEPILAFEATLTDDYFRNGVMLGDRVLGVFDVGTYGDQRTIETRVPLTAVRPGEPFTVSIVSGTKAATGPDSHEGNDDFAVSDVRLVLPDGGVVRPVQGRDPSAWVAVGDGARATDALAATFVVPASAFTAVAYSWETGDGADGPHRVTARAGSAEATLGLEVDNTAPVLAPSIVAGTTIRGEVELDVVASDAGSGVDEVAATLDGRAVTLPVTASSLTGEPGDHVLTATATDREGNAASVTVPFSVPHELPAISATGEEGSLHATATDVEGDAVEVTFARGRALALGAEVTVSSGTTPDAAAVDRPEARAASTAEFEALAAPGSGVVAVEADGGLPYQLVEARVPAGSEAASVRLRWDGTANAGARVTLRVLDAAGQAWVEADSVVTPAGDGQQDVALDGVVSVGDHARDGVVTALVQHSDGYAGADLTTRESAVAPHHPDDTPRDQYDFTIAWESDTQYYNARADIFDRQLSIHDFLLERREALNLQYMVHTGDIVDLSADEAQWLRAEEAYAPLDEADLPYGVLAGNHDVDQQTNDYTDFSRWFGDQRFAHRPWFGGSHEDNRGHYDLVTAGGVDLMFVYMGWGAADEQIAWLNEVLARHPERVAVLALHEYMLTTGGLGIIPQRIHDEVVATNPNVRMVMSGHYHDAFTRLDRFDDDGDGTPDRAVTSMLFDYQDLPNGGEGYLRLLHFDNDGQRILVRTYSDHLEDYSAVHPSLSDHHQEFEIPYAQAGITVSPKVLTADAVRVDVLTDEVIAEFSDVASGSSVSAEGEAVAAAWYARAEDPYGAVAYSEVVTPAAVTVAQPVPQRTP